MCRGGRNVGKPLGAAGIAALALSALLYWSPSARAQSAADKATARATASEGIKLFNAGDYAAALDRLKRAQALYDAPPHLLYMARAQIKLGQLVEASENYQLLVRYDLGAAPPPAFTNAVEEGRKELAALEPKIPTLKVLVTPEDIESLELSIDGRSVSTAVVGLNRPINPGDHTVVAQAPGYITVEDQVTLEEGQAEEVGLVLELDPNAPVAPVTGGAEDTDEPKKEEPEGKPGLVGVLVGLRLGAGIPGGKLYAPAAIGTEFGVNASDSTGDYFKPGFSGEFHVGVRIAQYFTPLFYVQGMILGAGEILPNDDVTFKNDARAGSIGGGVMVGTAPTDFGGFGEFDVGFDAYGISSEVVDMDCKIGRGLSGLAFRFAGGGVFPVAKYFNLNVFAALGFGKFNTVSQSLQGSACGNLGLDADRAIAPQDQRMHTTLSVGMGGDFVFGKDLRY